MLIVEENKEIKTAHFKTKTTTTTTKPKDFSLNIPFISKEISL